MNNELKKLRDNIDLIDDEIVTLLSKRFDIVKEVAKVKKEHNIDLLDEKRLKELVEAKKEKAKQLGISESFIENLFHLIHDHALHIEEKI